MVQDRTVIN